MKLRYKLLLSIAPIFSYSLQHTATPKKATAQTKSTVKKALPTAQYSVLIDPSAAKRFQNTEATMSYTYSVALSDKNMNNAQGEGTFNFNNAVKHLHSSLSSFSKVDDNKMADIVINTASIKVGKDIYEPIPENPVTIKADGYPYAIIYDTAKDYFQILDKNKTAIFTLNRSIKK